MNIINLQYIYMPPGMHGATTKNDDGSYTVFLDPRDSCEMQKRGYLHELEHIDRGDLDNRQEKNIGQIEKAVHLKGLDDGIFNVPAEIPCGCRGRTCDANSAAAQSPP